MDRRSYLDNQECTVTIPCESVSLNGDLFIPKNSHSLVIFVHGSGSSRFSKRNQYVAKILNNAGLGTLLFDLLTPDEEAIDIYTREFRFNINFLASRLLIVTHWIAQQSIMQDFLLGYFGASTGGSAALVAAAQEPKLVQAIVSRGGRPDLAGKFLSEVKAPTLLIVGGEDEPVITMNQQAMQKLNCIKKLEIVPKATHLFEEPGALDEVSHLAKLWFLEYLKTTS